MRCDATVSPKHVNIILVTTILYTPLTLLHTLQHLLSIAQACPSHGKPGLQLAQMVEQVHTIAVTCLQYFCPPLINKLYFSSFCHPYSSILQQRICSPIQPGELLRLVPISLAIPTSSPIGCCNPGDWSCGQKAQKARTFMDLQIWPPRSKCSG